MKMDVSTALELILSKMVNPCLTTSSRIQRTCLFLLSMTEEVKENLQTSIFVNIHHVSWYLPCTYGCIPIVQGQCWLQFSQIIALKWINLEYCLDGFPKKLRHLHCVHMFLICWAERCNLHDEC